MTHGTDWFMKAGWGVFTHYLTGADTTVDEWNRMVDGFDVEGLAQQLESVGAKYYFITLGQNSGHYCAPNATYDQFVGITPSKCSRRDLVSDLYTALSRGGISLLVYLPSGAPDQDPVAMKALEWKSGRYGYWAYPEGGPDDRLESFQRKWEAVIREWSLRWGRKVRGWWFDGCYFPDAMYRHPEPPNFESFASAARAGNPDAIVAFNPGVMPQRHPALRPDRQLCSISEYEDYTAGEVADWLVDCHGRWVESITRGTEHGDHLSQFHVLTYLGERWGGGKPRFTDRFVIEYTREINAHGGVVTYDVPILRSGLIAEEFARQLQALHDGLAKPAESAPAGNLACFRCARVLDAFGSRVQWVSSEGGWHNPRYGVDGDRSTWAEAADQYSWTYEVDLGKVHRVRRVVITFAPDRYAVEYRISASANGKEWHVVADQIDCEGGTQAHEFAFVRARFVRVTSLKPDGPNQPGVRMGIAELEVYE
ncbi:MAG: discoidin domain-containing protein [Armatimonadota bacterium]